MFEYAKQRAVSQQAVENAPCITFGQFRHVANQQEWSIGWLVEQVKGEIDTPTDTVRRIMHGTLVDGKHQLLADVITPYTCLIELFQQATTPKPPTAGRRLVVAGVGVLSGASSEMRAHYAGRRHRGHAVGN
jgi:hypothetical protein